MGVKKYHLGDLLRLSTETNFNSKFGIDSVKGVSIQKSFIETKADMTGVSLLPYSVVRPDYFSYVSVTSRNGGKISIAYNNSNETFIVSSSYIVFFVDKTDIILPEYIFLYFNRPEFDRYARFHSWGSAREVFSWDDMCDIEIELPSLPTQRKYVSVYKAILANKLAHESSLDDLNPAIAASLEEFKHTSPRVPIGSLLEEIDKRNNDGSIDNVQGININKKFMPSVANLSKTDLTRYKVIKKNQFAANFMHVMRDEKIPFGLYHEDKPCIVSPAYPVFKVKSNVVLAEFIMLWLNRVESDRYAWFISDSSIRGGLETSRFLEIEIPLPSIPQQQAIINFYNVSYFIQRNIAMLEDVLKDICSILVKGAVGDAK